MVVRPEDILLRMAPDGPYTIVEKTFMGSHTEYVVEGDGSGWKRASSYKQNSELETGAQVAVEIGPLLLPKMNSLSCGINNPRRNSGDFSMAKPVLKRGRVPISLTTKGRTSLWRR